MYRQIHSEMWREGWFERWGSSTKLVFLCLLTGSEIRPSGFLIETPERIAFATGLTAECVRTSLAGMLPKVVWWSDHDAIWIVRFFRWQGAGPKWIRAVQKDVVALPSYARTAWDAEYPPDTLSIGYAYPSDGYTGKDFHNPVTHKEQEQEQDRTGQEQHSTPVPLPSPGDTTPKKTSVVPVYPEWFDPITQLPGFLRANHARAIEAIIAACEVQDINPAALMVEFAAYWPRGRLSTSEGGHGWTNPVRALIKTLDVQISKHLRGGNNSHANDGGPIWEQGQGTHANTAEAPSPFAKYR